MNEKNQKYDGPYRYAVSVQESPDGTRRVLFPALGNVVLQPNEQVMMYHVPGQPIAFLYTFLEMNTILPWLEEQQKAVSEQHKIMFDDSDSRGN